MKNLKITVNGIEYKVKVEEIEEQEMLQESNKNPNKQEPVPLKIEKNDNKKDSNQSATGEPINAPMPGTIVSVKVSQGQSVLKGDVLLVLEAMKMENEIMSPKDAVISSVNVKKGDSVEAGTPLIFLK